MSRHMGSVIKRVKYLTKGIVGNGHLAFVGNAKKYNVLIQIETI